MNYGQGSGNWMPSKEHSIFKEDSDIRRKLFCWGLLNYNLCSTEKLTEEMLCSAGSDWAECNFWLVRKDPVWKRWISVTRCHRCCIMKSMKRHREMQILKERRGKAVGQNTGIMNTSQRYFTGWQPDWLTMLMTVLIYRKSRNSM